MALGTQRGEPLEGLRFGGLYNKYNYIIIYTLCVYIYISHIYIYIYIHTYIHTYDIIHQ